MGKLFSFFLFSTCIVFGSTNHEIDFSQTKANSYSIEVGDPTESEIDKNHFFAISNIIYAMYHQEGVSRGRPFKINLDWETPYFSAWASNLNDEMAINFWGGMARIPHFVKETWAFVVCHEIGHILAGEPYEAIPQTSWASTEGQSDHFALTECLPKYFKKYDPSQVSISTVMPYEVDLCYETYSNQPINQNICLKILKAGRHFLAVIDFLNSEIPNVSYKTPAPATEKLIDKAYPTPQCRLDIFKNGALCLEQGSCPRNNCWYVPKE